MGATQPCAFHLAVESARTKHTPTGYAKRLWVYAPFQSSKAFSKDRRELKIDVRPCEAALLKPPHLEKLVERE